VIRRLWILFPIAALVFLSIPLHAQQESEDASAKLLNVMKRAEASYSKFDTYRAVVTLEERIKGKMNGIERIDTMFSKSPFKVSFEWKPGGRLEGFRASHVLSRDGDQHFLARGAGLAGIVGATKFKVEGLTTAKILPHHFKMTQYHIGFLLHHAKSVVDKAKAKGMLKVKAVGADMQPGATAGLTYYRVFLSDDPADGLLYKGGLFGIDSRTSIPFYIELYDFAGNVHARYRVLSLDTNVALDEKAFDLE
jgi:Protein of unknown function (DUF1571)